MAKRAIFGALVIARETSLTRCGDLPTRPTGSTESSTCGCAIGDFLGGEEFSIADIASYPWAVGWDAQGQVLDDFKHFKRWFLEVGARPGVQRGMEAGSGLGSDLESVPEHERKRMFKLLFNQRAIPVPD